LDNARRAKRIKGRQGKEEEGEMKDEEKGG